jgi:hypothetical protein
MGQNESKATLIDVIGSLCVSLGSSTVQLHDSLSTGLVFRADSPGKAAQWMDRSIRES